MPDSTRPLIPSLAGLLMPALLLLMMAPGMAGCSGESTSLERPPLDTTDTRSRNLLELARMDRQLTRFVRAIELAGLSQTLQELGPYTIFAPNNAAFSKAAYRADSLLSKAHADSLGKLLRLHVVRGRVGMYPVGDSQRVSTLFEQPLLLSQKTAKQPLRVNGFPVLKKIEGQNGVLYVIGSVLAIPKPDTTKTDSTAVDSLAGTRTGTQPRKPATPTRRAN